MSTHYVRVGNKLRRNRADGNLGEVVVTFDVQSEGEIRAIIKSMEETADEVMRKGYTRP